MTSPGKSDLIEMSTWSDPDENDGEWPYPNEYRKHLVTGELAVRCRAALEMPEDWPVYITECVTSGGWSEYTQENYSDFTIECGGQEKTFSENFSAYNTLEQLLRWLDAESA